MIASYTYNFQCAGRSTALLKLVSLYRTFFCIMHLMVDFMPHIYGLRDLMSQTRGFVYPFQPGTISKFDDTVPVHCNLNSISPYEGLTRIAQTRLLPLVTNYRQLGLGVGTDAQGIMRILNSIEINSGKPRIHRPLISSTADVMVYDRHC